MTSRTAPVPCSGPLAGNPFIRRVDYLRAGDSVVPQATYVFVFWRVVVHGPQLAVFEMRKLPRTGSDLPVEFFATDLYFLSCDDFDNFPCERGPFLFEPFYGPECTWQSVGRRWIRFRRTVGIHRYSGHLHIGVMFHKVLEEFAAVKFVVGNQSFHVLGTFLVQASAT
jgi:hypothetical protein